MHAQLHDDARCSLYIIEIQMVYVTQAATTLHVVRIFIKLTNIIVRFRAPVYTYICSMLLQRHSVRAQHCFICVCLQCYVVQMH